FKRSRNIPLGSDLTLFCSRIGVTEAYLLVVEKMLASEGIKRVELGREECTKRVWEWKEKYAI
ncbi:hypothetical protein AALP_AAs73179U000100, partial [Arabis alpina]